MNEREHTRNDAGERTPAVRLKRLTCKRTNEQVELVEHERCPYCFGRLTDVASGRHEAFCDYRPGIDPVHFGFPGGEPRLEEG